MSRRTALGMALLLASPLGATIGAQAPSTDAATGSRVPGREAVTYLADSEVRKAFSLGAPLLERSTFKVHASRRDGPGEAEIHERDTDIMYVLQGTATFVTDGDVVQPRNITPQEIRGRSLRGGQVHQLGAGDIIVIPSGISHWFRSVDSTFLYYVVKVTDIPS